jgi:hypothetical protein
MCLKFVYGGEKKTRLSVPRRNVAIRYVLDDQCMSRALRICQLGLAANVLSPT